MCTAAIMAGPGGGELGLMVGQSCTLPVSGPWAHFCQWDRACPELPLVLAILPGIKSPPTTPHCPTDQVPCLQSVNEASRVWLLPTYLTAALATLLKFPTQTDPVHQIQFTHLPRLTQSYPIPLASGKPGLLPWPHLLSQLPQSPPGATFLMTSIKPRCSS